MADKDNLLTAGKIAKELGVSAAKVKKVITSLELEADNVRCGCSYYTPASVKKIKKALPK